MKYIFNHLKNVLYHNILLIAVLLKKSMKFMTMKQTIEMKQFKY